MPLPAELDRKIRNRFDELIDELEALLKDLDEYSQDHYVVYREWQVKTGGLLVMVYGDSEELGKYLKTIERYPGQTGGVVGSPLKKIYASSVEDSIATLKGIRDNYVNGFLVSIQEAIIANLSAGYMAQAEALLGEGIEGQYDHVPAAVLCGAVLENRIRTYCEQQRPPLPTVTPKGDAMTLGPLISELDKAKAFDKQTRNMLKSWADIRNHAAHGRFCEFTREQVELMLMGANQFLANQL